MNEDMMFFQKYYIRTRDDSSIIYSFSNAFEQPQYGDILINDRGEGTQFRLFPGGEENPLLFHDQHMIPLYKWDGSQVLKRSEADINADIKKS